MKFNTIIFASVVVIGALAQTAAFAQEASAPTAPSAAASQAETNPGSSKSVPNIVVRWDCGDCEENPKVAPLIEKTYQAQALADGHTVSTTETAQVTIKEYRQRHPAARSLFGAFSGKDKLATKLSFRGKDYDAADYSANAFQGMNSLCESIARQTLAQVLAAR